MLWWQQPLASALSQDDTEGMDIGSPGVLEEVLQVKCQQ